MKHQAGNNLRYNKHTMNTSSKTTKFLERILTPYSMIVINILIIFLTEILGGGQLFYNTGIIHAIALIFIFLAASRIMQRYYIFDPELRKLLKASLFAQAFFALSHFIEFASFQLFHIYTDAAFANVANFYIISLLFMFLGAEYVMEARDKKTRQLIRAASFAIVVFLALTAAFMFNNQLISLDGDQIAPYAYGLFLLFIGIVSIIRLYQVSQRYKSMKPFVTYLIQATILIIAAALPNIFYDVLGDWGVNQIQVIYLSHFTFYAALSVMFLAYGDSLKIGGIHKDIREAVERGELKL